MAVGILAQPQQALDLFDQGTQLTTHDPAGHTDDTAGDLGTGQAQQSGRSPFGRPGVDPRPPATLYIHLSEDSFTRDADGVARFEGEGPVTIEQVKRWLGHCQVTVKPVIDLAAGSEPDRTPPHPRTGPDGRHAGGLVEPSVF